MASDRYKKMRENTINKLARGLVQSAYNERAVKGVAQDKDTLIELTLWHIAEILEDRVDKMVDGQGLGVRILTDITDSSGRLLGGNSDRHSPESKEWRKAVFERDGYKCAECGEGGRLNAHHIKDWAAFPSLRFDVSNGVTLCIECHCKRHPKRAALIRKARYHEPKE